MSRGVLQFGHGCGAVEIRREARRLRKPLNRASIRPRLRSRGDLKLARMYSRTEAGLQFGHGCGAVEMGTSNPAGVTDELASIRPRLRSRGDVWSAASWSASAVCFNSATAAEPWRCGKGRCHRCQGRGASIRPRLRSRGDYLVSREMGLFGKVLQFGHGCGAVEMPDMAGLNCLTEHCFNSATAAEPWR